CLVTTKLFRFSKWLLTLRLQLRVHPMQQSNVEQQQQLRLLRARLGGFFEETVSELERRQSELYRQLSETISAPSESSSAPRIGLDLSEAGRRVSHLLDCLRLDWTPDTVVSENSVEPSRSSNYNTVYTATGGTVSGANSANQSNMAATEVFHSTVGNANQSYMAAATGVARTTLGNTNQSNMTAATGVARTTLGNTNQSNMTAATGVSRTTLGNTNQSNMTAATGVARTTLGNTNQSNMTAATGVARTILGNTNQSNLAAATGVARTTLVNTNQSNMAATGFSPNSSGSSYSTALGSPNRVDHDAKLYVQQFRTMNSPYSIASIHGKFYTVEKNSVHRYDAVSGKYRGQLRVTDFDGVEMQHTKAYRLSSCKTNDWLITVDKRNDMVLCVDSKHRCELEIGPKVSARYFLENPEQAVSNGSCLFICCPLVGIFILVVDSAYSAVRVVTQTCEYLDLEQPVRMAWCESAGHLVVVDDEDGRYVARAFEFANCHKPSGGLMLNSEFYACLASDRTPEIAYLPSGGSGFSPLAVIVDGYELMQFRDESFRRLDRNPLRRLNYTCEFGNWERLTDVCWVDDPVGDGGSRLAVCDKRGCRVSLLRLEP
ncbi:hypothetical protein BOX15_Mlig027204g2, partial [Macrostomum lignano]